MRNIKKYSAYLIPFTLLLILLIVYKSIDNFSAVKDGFMNFMNILKPFFIGFAVAYILNIPCKKLENLFDKSKIKFIKQRKKGLSIISVYFLAILIIVVVVRALVPAVYRNIVDLYNNAPSYIQTITGYIDMWQERLDIKIIETGNGINTASALEKILKSFDFNELSKYAQGVINLTSGVIDIFIAIIVSVYMLVDKEKIKTTVKNIFSALYPEEKVEKISENFKKVNGIFAKFIYCRVIDGLIMAVLVTLCLMTLRVKYALILGIMVGFCNLIPYFGSIISSIIATIITLVTGGFAQMVWVGILMIFLQQIDGNYIGPKIMGDVLEISPLLVIFAVTVGGGLFGVLGMLLAVPLMVALKMMFDDYISIKVKEKNTK